MAANPSGPGSGMFASLRRLTDTAIGIAVVRLELFGTELEQEKLRLLGALVRAAIGLMLLGVAALLLVVFVLLLFWEGYRLAAVAVMALLFAGGGAWLLQAARAHMRAGEGGPFALSLAEFRRDRAGLGTPSE